MAPFAAGNTPVHSISTSSCGNHLPTSTMMQKGKRIKLHKWTVHTKENNKNVDFPLELAI
jgi:hypothetical protein